MVSTFKLYAMGRNMNPGNKTDQCFRYVDIGIAVNSPEQLFTELRAVFKCIQKVGLKLSMAKRHFRSKEVDSLG